MRKRTIVLILALISTSLSFAQMFESDGIWYKIISSANKKVSVIPGAYHSYSGVITIPGEVIYDAVTYSVSQIGDGAFYDCRGLISVTLPESIVEIGNGAFYGCTRLTTINIPTGVKKIDNDTFEGCMSLRSINIPNGVDSIEGHAFGYCSGLSTISIPSSVTYIGTDVFYGCTKVDTLFWDSDVSPSCITQYCRDNLKHVVLGNEISSIGDNAFRECVNLMSLTIPNSIISIGISSFAYCSGLTEIKIPESVKTIQRGAFFYCTSLKSIIIPEGITSIEDEMFYGCSSLKSITIPESVTSIKDFAFSGCSSLDSIYLSNNISEIGDNAFFGTPWLKLQPCGLVCIGSIVIAYNDCSLEKESISIPDGITEIAGGAFSYCDNLESITIPESVVRIGEFAFSSCSKLTTVVINGNIPSIEIGTFSQCRNLISIKIPESVTSIKEDAFYECSALKEITIPNNVSKIGHGAFCGCTGLEYLFIPASVSNIDDSFEGCSGLSAISVDPENRVYDSRDGCNAIIESVDTLLYSSYYGGVRAVVDGRLILGCKNTVIPQNVIRIGSEAFNGCIGLTDLFIPVNVKYIENGAFTGCLNLAKIHVDTNNKYYDSREDCNAIIESIDSTEFGKKEDLYQFVWRKDVLKLGCKNTVIPYGIKIIGYDAFSECVDLTEIDIPESVTSIEDYAFAECVGLTKINIPESVTSIGSGAFRGCSNLGPITIPASVTRIGYQAFSGCSGLTDIIIEKGKTYIENRAFEGCTGLSTIEIPEGIERIGDGAFSGCTNLKSITIPNTVTSIGYGSFSDCTSLSSIIISEMLTEINYETFHNCSSLTSIFIPSGITKIHGNPFEGCVNLTSITVDPNNMVYDSRDNCNAIIISTDSTEYYPYYSGYRKLIKDCLIVGCKNTVIPLSVTGIGHRAFSGCTGLTSINIPAGVEVIGGSAFENCSGLTSINIPTGVEVIGITAFCNCSGLTSINIPESVRIIGTDAFCGCSGLSSITVDPNNRVYDSRDNCNAIIESIDSTYVYYDYYDYNLEEAIKDRLILGCKNTVIPASVKEIGDYAFLGCSSLVSLNLPSGITHIGDYVFNGCNDLKIYCFAPVCPQISTNTFYNVKEKTLLVPRSLYELYANNDGWNKFDRIIPLEDTLDIVMSDAGYITHYYDGSYILPEGLSAMVVSDISSDGELVYKTIATGAESGVIPSGEAVVLASDRPGTFRLILNTDNNYLYDGNNLLVGSDVDTITYSKGIEGSMFYKLSYGPSNTDLSDVLGWYWGADNGAAFQIEGHKAWLSIPVSQSSSSGYSISGTPVCVKAIPADIIDQGAVIYDLNGIRQLTPIGNGMLIINGKVVIAIE